MAYNPIAPLQLKPPDDRFRIEFDHEHGRATLYQNMDRDGVRYTRRTNLKIVSRGSGIDMVLAPDPTTGVYEQVTRDA